MPGSIIEFHNDSLGQNFCVLNPGIKQLLLFFAMHRIKLIQLG